MPGTLYVIATPIGNMEDITLRALRVLGEVGALACEDTRFTRRIFERHQIASPKTIFSCHEHNEEMAARRILGLLEAGSSVALCSDGGSPGVSDPGYRIISMCREKGIPVDVLPGASAVTTALVASGLSTASYTFKGFPPRKPGPRRRFLETERDQPHTIVLFESPFRIGRLLEDAHEVLGNRLAAVCLELTKKFEEIHRGFLADLAQQFAKKAPKGEITVVIAGNNPKFEKGDDDSPAEDEVTEEDSNDTPEDEL